MNNKETIELIKKVILFIQSDSSAKKMFISAGGRENYTVWEFFQAAGNHLFDDHPEIFNITESQGHSIRRYTHTTTMKQASIDLDGFLNPGQSSLD